MFFDFLLIVTISAGAIVCVIGVLRKVGLVRATPRLILRRFLFLQDNLSYVDEACLLLLKTEIDDSGPTEGFGRRHGVKLPSERSSADNIDVSIAGTRIPLSFVWRWARNIIYGNPVIIDCLVSRSENGTLLAEGWATNDDNQFAGWSSNQKGADPIRTAIRRLAEDIRSAYPRYQPALLNQYLSEERYTDARALLDRISRADTKEKTSLELADDEWKETLGWIQYGVGDYEGALEIFNRLGQEDTVIARIECLINMFRYEDALELIASAKSGITDYERLLRRARTLRMIGDLESATRCFYDCIENALQEISDNGDDPDDRDPYWTIVYANQYAAECMLPMGRQTERIVFLDGQLASSRALQKLDRSTQAISYEAWALQDLEQYEEAKQIYQFCETRCLEDSLDRPDDVEYMINHAWAIAGLAKALHLDTLSKLAGLAIGDDELENLSATLWQLGEHLDKRSTADRARRIQRIVRDELDFSETNDFEDDVVKDVERLRADPQTLKEILEMSAERFQTTMAAFDAFSALTVRESRTHVAEGHYGMACIWAIFEKWSDSEDELIRATSLDPAIIERACWDHDLIEFRQRVFGGRDVPVTWEPETGWFVSL